MFQDFQEHKYYVIHSLVKSSDNERLFPFTFPTKADSDDFINSISSNPDKVIKNYFPNDPDLHIQPFLHFEKTLITQDQIESDDSLLNKPTGRITSNIIPMDFISSLYFATPINNSKLTDMISDIISEATSE